VALVFVSYVPLPSRSHSYLVMVVPAAAVEPDPLNDTVFRVSAGFGDTVNDAVGPPVIVRLRVVVAMRPRLSVIRRPTVTVPAAVYAFVVVRVVPVSSS
jgi:hypothetical protein